jgi:hypothetical protein
MKRIRVEAFDARKLARMTLVRERLNWYGDQDHQRWTYKYRDRLGRVSYYKVWNRSYVRRDTMLPAIDAGFYDEQLTPALRAILVDGDGAMRGYVTAACHPRADRDHLDAHFYEQLKRKTESTGFFNYDVRPHHILRYRLRLSLIDLEGVYPLDQFPLLARCHCHFGDADYERFVARLFDG